MIRKKKIVIIMVILTLVGSLGFSLTTKDQPVATSVVVKLGDISDTIQERGVFFPVEKQTVFSEVTGQVESILVETGHYTSQGQLVLSVTKSDIDYQIRQADFKLKSDLVELKTRQRQLRQKTELVKENIIAIEEVKSLESELSKLQLSIDSRSSEIAYLKQKRELHDVKSDVQGVVSAVFVEAGQMVEPGTLLMKIKNITDLKIDVLIREYEAHKIKVGQSVNIKSSIVPQQIIKGVVSKIVPSIDDDHGGSGMNIEIRSVEDMSNFNVYPGNQVDLEIVVRHREKCLVLPITAVKNEQGRYFVVLENGLQKKEVKIGIQDQTNVEIIEGLTLHEGVVNDTSY